MNDSIFTNTMADMNWKEVEEKGRKNIPVLFPIGVIEQHGPHLPLGYAGNPAGYEKKLPEVRKTFDILCEFIADQI